MQEHKQRLEKMLAHARRMVADGKVRIKQAEDMRDNPHKTCGCERCSGINNLKAATNWTANYTKDVAALEYALWKLDN
jgi:hypothetical protein